MHVRTWGHSCVPPFLYVYICPCLWYNFASKQHTDIGEDENMDMKTSISEQQLREILHDATGLQLELDAALTNRLHRPVFTGTGATADYLDGALHVAFEDGYTVIVPVVYHAMIPLREVKAELMLACENLRQVLTGCCDADDSLRRAADRVDRAQAALKHVLATRSTAHGISPTET